MSVLGRGSMRDRKKVGKGFACRKGTRAKLVQKILSENFVFYCLRRAASWSALVGGGSRWNDFAFNDISQLWAGCKCSANFRSREHVANHNLRQLYFSHLKNGFAYIFHRNFLRHTGRGTQIERWIQIFTFIRRLTRGNTNICTASRSPRPHRLRASRSQTILGSGKWIHKVAWNIFFFFVSSSSSSPQKGWKGRKKGPRGWH